MITKKIHIDGISEPEFVKEKQDNYSYAFRLLYKMLDESTNRDFVERFMKRFKMNNSEYTSLRSDVKSFRNREDKQKENSLKRIENAQKELEKDGLSKKQRFKKINTIVYLTKRLEHESAFGGLELQRKLTRECNKSVRDEKKN